jgi:hypothetical protein
MAPGRRYEERSHRASLVFREIVKNFIIQFDVI